MSQKETVNHEIDTSISATHTDDSASELSTSEVVDLEKTIQHDGDIIATEDEELIFNPYNEDNVEITLSEVQSILTRYGVPGTVHNLNLYKRAFIHRSYTKRPFLENQENGIEIAEQPDDCMTLKTKSNERLEFLGDGVLECITKFLSTILNILLIFLLNDFTNIYLLIIYK